MVYDKGDRARISVLFKADNVAADPTAITVTVKKPKTPGITYSFAQNPSVLIQDSAGSYHVDVDLDVAGTWHYRWVATGSVVAAEEGRFFVRNSHVG